MNRTFINQADLDRLDACMACLADLNQETATFITEMAPATSLEKFKLELPRLFLSPQIRQGQKYGDLWKLRTHPDVYQYISDLVSEFKSLSKQLLSEASALSVPEKQQPFASMFSSTPVLANTLPEQMENCRNKLRTVSYILNATSMLDGFPREPIHQILPRILDFMNTALTNFQTRTSSLAKKFDPKRETIPAQIARISMHYRLGMESSAYFVIQHHRIGTLITQAYEQLDTLEETASVRALTNRLKTVQIGISEAQRFCDEIVGLRRRD